MSATIQPNGESGEGEPIPLGNKAQLKAVRSCLNPASNREYAILSNGSWQRVVIQTIVSIRDDRAMLCSIFDVPDEWLTDYLTVKLAHL